MKKKIGKLLLAAGIVLMLAGAASAQVNVEFEGQLYHTWQALKEAAEQNSPSGAPTMHCGQVITEELFDRGIFVSRIDRFRCYRSAADFHKFKAAMDLKLAELQDAAKAEQSAFYQCLADDSQSRPSSLKHKFYL